MTKHTKGPWTTDGADILAPETRFRDKHAPLASVNVESASWPADAVLIVAAPELLAAAKLALKALNEYQPKSFEQYELAKAIAKAEGRGGK